MAALGEVALGEVALGSGAVGRTAGACTACTARERGVLIRGAVRRDAVQGGVAGGVALGDGALGRCGEVGSRWAGVAATREVWTRVWGRVWGRGPVTRLQRKGRRADRWVADPEDLRAAARTSPGPLLRERKVWRVWKVWCSCCLLQGGSAAVMAGDAKRSAVPCSSPAAVDLPAAACDCHDVINSIACSCVGRSSGARIQVPVLLVLLVLRLKRLAQRPSSSARYSSHPRASIRVTLTPQP